MDEIVCGGRSRWCVCGVKYIAIKTHCLKKKKKNSVYISTLNYYVYSCTFAKRLAGMGCLHFIGVTVLVV